MTSSQHDLARWPRRIAIGVAVVVAAACSTTGPTSPSATDPHFLAQNSAAPPVLSASVSFYAVVGQTRQGALYYVQTDSEGEKEDSVELAGFVVPAGALVTAADGSQLAPGDSVLITLSLVDTTHNFVQIDPSGLQFAPSTPAQLTFGYQEDDSTLTKQNIANLAIWSEDDSGNWTQLPSVVSTKAKQVSAHVSGMHAHRSVYASAY
jgi:hypothetical protein